MTRTEFAFAAVLMCCLAPAGTRHAAAMPSLLEIAPVRIVADATSAPTRLAQAQPAQTPAATPTASPAPDQAAAAEPIGNVATLTGSATVTRNSASASLNLQDDIFQGDILQTQANSALGVTFNDATTFNLTANARIEVDSFVYQDGGKQNGALFNVVKGTVAFAAAAVASTGDMRISTPTATLGIRGTTGLIEVPEGAGAGGASNVAIKLYPDADGKVGRIEVSDHSGARLGFLTRGSSGFTIRPGAGGRFAALPLPISPQQALRDQGFVRQVHAVQSVGRQIVTEKRIQRLQNPNRSNPANQPRTNQPANPALKPGLQKQNGLPQRRGSPLPNGLPQRNGLPLQPGVLRQPALQPPPGAPGLQQPGLQTRPALQPRRPALPVAPKGKPKEKKH